MRREVPFVYKLDTELVSKIEEGLLTTDGEGSYRNKGYL